MLLRRFIIVGIYNTVVGYVIFVGLNFLLKSFMLHYLVILILSYIISVTHAYATQRYFVFKTNNPVITEYLRFFIVNLVGLTANAGILHVIMEVGCGISVYVAQALALGLVTGLSYFGHKFFSFSNRTVIE